CFPHGRRARMSAGQVAVSPSVVAGWSLVPMGVTMRWVQADTVVGTDGAGLAVSLVPAVVAPGSATMAGIPTYAYVLVGSPPAPPPPDPGPGGAAGPRPGPPGGRIGRAARCRRVRDGSPHRIQRLRRRGRRDRPRRDRRCPP